MGAIKIGQVAQQTGVSVDTIRFYERRGVLPRPARRASGYRVYTEATFERIRLVKTLQGLGFTLDEVIDALRTVDQGLGTCESERRRLEAVLERVDRNLEELQRVRRGVVRVLDGCHAGQCSMEASSADAGLIEEGTPEAAHAESSGADADTLVRANLHRDEVEGAA